MQSAMLEDFHMMKPFFDFAEQTYFISIQSFVVLRRTKYYLHTSDRIEKINSSSLLSFMDILLDEQQHQTA